MLWKLLLSFLNLFLLIEVSLFFVLGEYKSTLLSYMCFPGGSDSKESAYKAARPWFDLWVWKIPWRRQWQPTQIFLPGESHEQFMGSQRAGHDWVTNTSFSFRLQEREANSNAQKLVQSTHSHGACHIFLPQWQQNISMGILFQERWKLVCLSGCTVLLSHFSRVRLCATPETAAHQAPPSLGFSRQEHWSGLPFPSPMQESEKWKWSRSVVSDSLRPHGLQPTRLPHPWGFPGKSTGVGCQHTCPSSTRFSAVGVFSILRLIWHYWACSSSRWLPDGVQ